MVKVLILGAGGMLGSTLFRSLSQNKELDLIGAVRGDNAVVFEKIGSEGSIVFGVDATQSLALRGLIESIQPHVVVNCIGVIKQKGHEVSDREMIEVNTLLPHMLAQFCGEFDARLIHFSTDCVFDGVDGGYTEDNLPNSSDLYGRSKALGEVMSENCLTLRTSIIGHELNSSLSLIDWFLSQSGEVPGFTRAYFSGLPTIYWANLLQRLILCHRDLAGLYHVSSQRISKFELLRLVSQVYSEGPTLLKDDSMVIDRSLKCGRFSDAVGWSCPAWPFLIKLMYEDFCEMKRRGII